MIANDLIENTIHLPLGDRSDRAVFCYRILKGLLCIAFFLFCHDPIATASMASYPVPVPSQSLSGAIKQQGEGFDIMNVQLVLGSKLYFSNPGNKPLEVDIDTWRGRPIKRLKVTSHHRMAWQPKQFGVFVFYNAKTTDFSGFSPVHSDGEKIYQVVARRHVPTYPVPAYGVVAVTNRVGGGIPLSWQYGPQETPRGNAVDASPRFHAFMRRGPWMEVTGKTMTFHPWVLIVKAGQPIEIYDEDRMDHAFFPGDYPVMYDDRGHLHWYQESFNGFELHKDGGHRSITFLLPGIHHILCVYHSYPWKDTYKTHHKAGDFPYIMDAIVVVEPDTRGKTGRG